MLNKLPSSTKINQFKKPNKTLYMYKKQKTTSINNVNRKSAQDIRNDRPENARPKMLQINQEKQKTPHKSEAGPSLLHRSQRLLPSNLHLHSHPGTVSKRLQ